MIIHSFVTITRLLCLSCVAEGHRSSRASGYLLTSPQMASLRPTYLFFFCFYSFSLHPFILEMRISISIFLHPPRSKRKWAVPGNSWLFPGARFFCTRYIYRDYVSRREAVTPDGGCCSILPLELYVFTTGKEEEEKSSETFFLFFLLLLLLLQQQSPKSLEDVLF